MTTRQPNKRAAWKLWKDAFRVLAVALFFLGMAILLKHPYIEANFFDMDTLRLKFQGGGVRNQLLFIGVGMLLNAIGIPRIWICAAGGSLFGALEGGVLGYVATLLGSSANFLVGRLALRGPLRRRMPRRLQRWYNAFNRHGFQAILYLRLFPLTNATLTNLLGGASQMRYRDFLAATAIGFLPFTIAFAMMGSSAAKQNAWQLGGGLVLFAAVIIGQWIWLRLKKKNKLVHTQVQELPDTAHGQ